MIQYIIKFLYLRNSDTLKLRRDFEIILYSIIQLLCHYNVERCIIIVIVQLINNMCTVILISEVINLYYN